MSKQDSLLKSQVALCSKCYTEIRLKCPVCLLDNIPRHCKIYKNPSSLWYHITQNHGKFERLEFSSNEVMQALNGLSLAVKWGVLPV